ncbi:hypothetical protein EYF80_067471 [Liparis tanakae]|uniref:Uncharacterized protein n=1 Tax=Liparis tanakae TaxID=230148 RepID=A0A4Z2E0W6_9TELE|nr:hypothetical protein EYF80_067471 [Liparis tanakae]
MKRSSADEEHVRRQSNKVLEDFLRPETLKWVTCCPPGAGPGGREDRRTGGPEDGRTGGREDGRTGGREDRVSAAQQNRFDESV